MGRHAGASREGKQLTLRPKHCTDRVCSAKGEAGRTGSVRPGGCWHRRSRRRSLTCPATPMVAETQKEGASAPRGAIICEVEPARQPAASQSTPSGLTPPSSLLPLLPGRVQGGGGGLVRAPRGQTHSSSHAALHVSAAPHRLQAASSAATTEVAGSPCGGWDCPLPTARCADTGSRRLELRHVCALHGIDAARAGRNSRGIGAANTPDAEVLIGAAVPSVWASVGALGAVGVGLGPLPAAPAWAVRRGFPGRSCCASECSLIVDFVGTSLQEPVVCALPRALCAGVNDHGSGRAAQRVAGDPTKTVIFKVIGSKRR